ncbi:2-amino-4-hydroxy-6-hydroxymethyldihydropteridinediphosphokinase [Paramicrobacterium humi]|uniref:2-amino-4-hydroxy-6-hydroxymethyldihydropteridine diphosphokinase n=1 Tax=Paramicrobacterium humi TaxID=640635 RepID=A0A1H4MQ98_9MICO|nr:2-amino-4-hydroxy-6-hydroxymethyldihydropteridine diphosphokinase [Microbacterium humi]SEB85017.1 2-amino-4-hydroxy-6-hydroxymethyldihydropteridinediphosphokinase [Microbacterium humi]
MLHDPVIPLREMRAVLALGSNLGDRQATLEGAVEDLRRTPGIMVDRVSSFTESVALTLHGEDASEPTYLNGVVIVRTVLRPRQLLAAVSNIENAHGRVRAERWGSRTLDIDIITYGDLRQDDDALTIPHPRAAERAFVLDPWLEIEPDAAIPGLGRIADLRARLEGDA